MQTLINHLTTYLKLQSTLSKSRLSSEKRAEVDKEFGWVEKFGKLYVQSRHARGQEISSPALLEARKLAREVIGSKNHDFFSTCIDGRCLPSVMFSKVPHEGGVLRSPAGIVLGFMDSSLPRTVRIDHHSPVIQQIKKLLLERPGETVYYSFDSHIGCAARGKMHTTEGGGELDGGLKSDLESKIMMAQGVLKLRQELADQGKQLAQVVPTFFSFDPHDGTIFVGLETQLDHPDVQKKGFSSEVLTKLREQNSIITTKDLLQDPEIIADLSQHCEAKSADMRHNFAESLKKNWQAISALYADGQGQLSLKLAQKLTEVYTNSGWVVGSEDNLGLKLISQKTIEQKTKFILKNIVTRYSIAGTDAAWPFDHHQEEVVVITEGGYGPFSEIDAFAVFAKQDETPNIVLATDLIRSTRSAGAITDPTKTYPTPTEFVSAPVIISSKAIAKLTDPKSWDVLEQLNLKDFFATFEWDSDETYSLRESIFKKQLTDFAAQQSQASLCVGDFEKFCFAAFELFARLRKYLSEKHVRKMILRGQIVMFHTIVDADRNPRIILPLVV